MPARLKDAFKIHGYENRNFYNDASSTDTSSLHQTSDTKTLKDHVVIDEKIGYHDKSQMGGGGELSTKECEILVDRVLSNNYCKSLIESQLNLKSGIFGSSDKSQLILMFIVGGIGSLIVIDLILLLLKLLKKR
jgi:hypothetical protein